jgi:hypothetical protein
VGLPGCQSQHVDPIGRKLFGVALGGWQTCLPGIRSHTQLLRESAGIVADFAVALEGKRKILTATVDTIEGISPSDPALIPPPEAKLIRHDSMAVPASVAQGKLVQKEMPILPGRCKAVAYHRQGDTAGHNWQRWPDSRPPRSFSPLAFIGRSGAMGSIALAVSAVSLRRRTCRSGDDGYGCLFIG